MRVATILPALLIAMTGAAWAQQGNPGQHFLEQWDSDADGRVTADEVTTRRRDIFYMFDQDSDGSLNGAEWALVAEHMEMELGTGGEGQGLNMAAPGKAVHEAMTPAFNDADADGTVTAAEFDAASAMLFPMMDADSDGAVTTADFRRP